MDFSGFSPDSFEQLTQVLATKVIGPGITIFGNGPDGGREATFKGKVNYPFAPATCWDGYGVLQAKFKEEAENTQKDQNWALAQLEKELKAWQDSNKRSPKPDYFIYCINVRLTSATNGGIDRADALLAQYKSSLGLKGYSIWDADKLQTLIDGQPDIRQRFTHFFTTGDLLATFANKLIDAPNAEAILTTYLTKEIIVDEDARINQAGDNTDDRIKLTDVFVDLPTGDQNSLQQLLRTASCKLDLKTLRQHNSMRDHQSDTLFSRFVLLGGPGSGKSTIGQFMCQIHRAALLARTDEDLLEYKVVKAVNTIRSRCEQEPFSWPASPRYPFRVDLNHFAKALADNTVNTLSAYLRHKLSQNETLSHNALTAWLQTYPWLLVLDGLDEVPTSSNRKEVIAAIEHFLDEARLARADLMVIATSRPDGYDNEFGSDEVSHNTLSPLSQEQALACTQRYVNAKFASKDDVRAADAMTTLREAINNSLIAKLMQSPLQVTFMVTVVAAGRKPSKSRWQLFKDYYDTIYSRELQKAVPPFSEVLNERQQSIDTLHHDVGFILQCRAELSGETQADMPIVQFNEMVTTHLQDDGLQGAELAQEQRLILGAASERLVFLTCKIKDRLSFDVRSLQEYMAAASLTAADSHVIINRLKAIAHSAYWRNTLLFAIGRFFVDTHLRNHRNLILSFCRGLNMDGVIEHETCKLGSRLALEILESGTIGNTPAFVRDLADCALELLAFPPDDTLSIPKRLAAIYSKEMQNEYQSQANRWIGQSEQSLTLSVWMLLFELEEKELVELDWASDMVTACWPTNPNHAWLLLETNLFNQGTFDIKPTETQMIRLEKSLPHISIDKFLSDDLFSRVRIAPQYSSWLADLIKWQQQKRKDIQLHNHAGKIGFTVKISFLQTPPRFDVLIQQHKVGECHPSWGVLLKIIEFDSAPSAPKLAATLKFIAEEGAQNPLWESIASWPLASCIKAASSKTQLKNMANQALIGAFGNIDNWLKMQKNWRDNDLQLDNIFEVSLSSSILFPALINPSCVARVGANKAAAAAAQFIMKAIIKNQQTTTNRFLILTMIHASINRVLHHLQPSQIAEYLLPKVVKPQSNLLQLTKLSLTNQQEWLDLFDTLGSRKDLTFISFLYGPNIITSNFLLEAYFIDITKVGLLRLAAFWCAADMTPTTGLSSLRKVEAYSTAQEKLAVIILKMSQNDLSITAVQEIANHIPVLTADDSEPNTKVALLSMIRNNPAQNPELIIVLAALIKTFSNDEWAQHSDALGIYSSMLQATKSHFDTQTLAKLSLPSVD
jgi:hypothetical protein